MKVLSCAVAAAAAVVPAVPVKQDGKWLFNVAPEGVYKKKVGMGKSRWIVLINIDGKKRAILLWDNTFLMASNAEFDKEEFELTNEKVCFEIRA